MQKNIYIFSGLGANASVFKKIQFNNCKVHFINWITPLKKERLEDYAKRIATQIHHQNPLLIGLSFGGIMATEVSKIIEVEKVILISSVKNKNEIPFYYQYIGWLGIYKLIPASLLLHPNFLTYYFFGINASDDKEILKQNLINTDPAFLKWAIDKILNYENIYMHKNTFHIHGTSDKLFPFKKIINAIEIVGGGHFMILNKAIEISNILSQII